MDIMTLLQRQMEVNGALRNPVKTPEDLFRVYTTMKGLLNFMNVTSKLATRLQSPLEMVFQCLMHLGMDSTPVDFDRQHRQGNVPMHQAKVLDRNATLNAQKIEPRLKAEVSDPVELKNLVEQCQILRSFLRMKVEDGNDLSMARKMIALSDEYLSFLHGASGGNPKSMMNMFLAEDEASLKKAITVAGAEGGVEPSSTLTSNPSSPLFPGEDEMEPVPSSANELLAAIGHKMKDQLSSVKPHVSLRGKALAQIHHWLSNCDAQRIFQLENNFCTLVSHLSEGIKLHLGEKRSALCRVACDILSILCLRAPSSMFMLSRIKEIISSWATVLLTQVHLSVAAIATATDGAFRDLVVASHGPQYLCAIIHTVLTKAAQPVLKQRCIGYLCIALMVNTKRAPVASTFLTNVLSKNLKSSEDPTRRLTRALGLLFEFYEPKSQGTLWDEKIEKMAASERSLIHDVAASEELDRLEIQVLGYDEPCRASAFHDSFIAGHNDNEDGDEGKVDPKQLDSHRQQQQQQETQDNSLPVKPSSVPATASSIVFRENRQQVPAKEKSPSPVDVRAFLPPTAMSPTDLNAKEMTKDVTVKQFIASSPPSQEQHHHCASSEKKEKEIQPLAQTPIAAADSGGASPPSTVVAASSFKSSVGGITTQPTPHAATNTHAIAGGGGGGSASVSKNASPYSTASSTVCSRYDNTPQDGGYESDDYSDHDDEEPIVDVAAMVAEVKKAASSPPTVVVVPPVVVRVPSPPAAPVVAKEQPKPKATVTPAIPAQAKSLKPAVPAEKKTSTGKVTSPKAQQQSIPPPPGVLSLRSNSDQNANKMNAIVGGLAAKGLASTTSSASSLKPKGGAIITTASKLAPPKKKEENNTNTTLERRNSAPVLKRCPSAHNHTPVLPLSLHVFSSSPLEDMPPVSPAKLCVSLKNGRRLSSAPATKEKMDTKGISQFMSRASVSAK